MAKRRANGEGSIYKRKDGLWCAQYTDAIGKVRTLYGKTQQIVKDKLKEAIRLNDTGVILESKRVSFPDWLDEWLEVYSRPTVKETTYINYHNTFNFHVRPYFNKVPLKDIRPEMLQKFFNEKLNRQIGNDEKGYAVETLAGMKRPIVQALNKAVELGYIPSNPAKKIKLPPMPQHDKRVLTRDEQKALESAALKGYRKDSNTLIYVLLLYTGLRIGEALGLRICDIDFDKRELYVRHTVSRVRKPDGGVEFYSRSTKTKSGKRTIPLSEKAITVLQGQIERRNELIENFYEDWKTEGIDTSKVDEGYIYISYKGNVHSQSTVDRGLQTICKKLEITPAVTLHGLRHTFATRWIEAGLDIRSLSEIMGHADVKMTLNTYAHALPEQKRKNMDVMSKLLDVGEPAPVSQ